MNRVTITLTIDLPDGVVPNVGYSTAPPTHRSPELERYDAAKAIEEPPHVAQTFAPFTPVATAEFWPAGDCPVHKKPFQDGKYGPFCSGKGGDGPVNAKGYCDLKPGMVYKGRNVPLLPVHA